MTHRSKSKQAGSCKKCINFKIVSIKNKQGVIRNRKMCVAFGKEVMPEETCKSFSDLVKVHKGSTKGEGK